MGFYSPRVSLGLKGGNLMSTPYDVLTELLDEVNHYPAKEDREVLYQSIQNVLLYAPALKRITLADKAQLWRGLHDWNAGKITDEFPQIIERIRDHYQK